MNADIEAAWQQQFCDGDAHEVTVTLAHRIEGFKSLLYGRVDGRVYPTNAWLICFRNDSSTIPTPKLAVSLPLAFRISWIWIKMAYSSPPRKIKLPALSYNPQPRLYLLGVHR